MVNQAWRWTMVEFIATMTSRGQVSIPAAVRRLLGLKPRDKVAFAIEGGEVKLRPLRYTLETILGSIEPLPGTTTADFETQIEAAMEEAAERRTRMLGLA